MILHQHISYTECPSMSHLGYVEMEGSESDQVFRLKDTSEARDQNKFFGWRIQVKLSLSYVRFDYWFLGCIILSPMWVAKGRGFPLI